MGARPRDPLATPTRPGDTWVLVVGCALAVAASVWLTWGIWAPGVPTGDDTAAALVRAEYANTYLFSDLQPEGWQSSFGLGYQEFLFVGPGFTVGVAALEALSFGALSTLGAFKLMSVISFAALPLAVAAL